MASRKKSFAEETALLEALIRDDPTRPEIFRLADLYTRTARFVEAVRVCREGLRHHPRSPVGLVALGRALFGMGNLAAASDVLEQAVQADPGVESHRLLGEVLLRRREFTRAVELLEDAVASGIDDPKVVAVLERARRYLDQDRTQVALTPPPGARGIGNRAVAGSIGSDGTTPVEGIEHGSVTPLVMTEGDEGKTRAIAAAMARAAASPVAPKTGEVDWDVIGSRWEEQLDAGFPDHAVAGDSDLRGPFIRRGGSLDLALSPLADPLAEGMPPLPEDATGEVDLAAIRDELAKTSVVPSPAAKTALDVARRVDDGEEPVTDKLPSVSAALDVARALEGPTPRPDPAGEDPDQDASAEAFDAILAERAAGTPRPWSDLLRAPEDEPPTEEHAATLDDPIAIAALDATLEHPRVLVAGPDDETAVASLEAEEGPIPVSAPRRRRRALGWTLVVCAILGSGGGYLGWRHWRGKRAAAAAIDRAAAALDDGGPTALRAARAELSRAARYSEEARSRADLVGAVSWLVHRDSASRAVGGAGDPPSWTVAATRGVLALAAGEVAQARRHLAARPTNGADRALGQLLQGWADWLGGERDAALRAADAAVALRSRMTLACVLRGHALRERGELAAAEQAYSGQGNRCADQELARLGLVATLMSVRPYPAERVEVALKDAPRGAEGKAWFRVLKAEHALRTTAGAAAAKELAAAVSAAPDSPALLFHGTLALQGVCDFDGARQGLGRLRKLRADSDPELAYLDGLLLFGEGRSREAAARLELPAASGRARRLRALALALAGDQRSAAAALGEDSSPAARPYALLLQVLGRADEPLDALQQLAARSPVARLGLTAALAARGAWGDAERSGLALAASHAFVGHALAFVARAQLEQGKRAAALDTLRRARALCDGYLPAQVQLGVELVWTGHYTEGIRELEAVRMKGAATAEALTALIAAHAEVGQKNQALVVLRELQKSGAETPASQLASGYLRLAEGVAARARDAFERAGDSFAALVGLGRAYLQLEHVAAVRTLQSAAAKDSTHPWPHLYLGNWYRDEEQRSLAAQSYRRALAAADAGFAPWIKARAHIGLAELASSAAAAIAQLKQALAADPSLAVTHRLLAQRYAAAGRHAAALQALERCLQLDPDDPSAWFLIASWHKDPTRAREAAERFLQLEPATPRAQALRKRLSRGGR